MANFITIIPAGTFTDATGTHTVSINHVLDADGEYTDDYQVLVDGKEQVLITLDDEAVWIEAGKGETERSRKLGELIEAYFE